MNAAHFFTVIYLFTFNTDSINNLPLNEPQALSVDLTGNIYISDTGNNRILKFTYYGQLIKVVGGFGWGKEQFDTPLDICTKSALDIFIADYNNQRIERYDKDLNYISSYSSIDEYDDRLRFGYPRSGTISIHGELLLIDSENNRILKINSFGEPEISFGDFAQGKGKLDDPCQIDIDMNDKIYVSDRSQNCILVYDYFGNYLSQIGSGLLNQPAGIFVDGDQRLWVADNGNRQVIAFNPAGGVLTQVSFINDSLKNLADPIDVVAQADKVHILDGNAVHVFRIIVNP